MSRATPADVAAFLGFAFRNVDLPALGEDDLAAIAAGLDAFADARELTERAGGASLGEYAGEHDPETFAAIGVPIAAVFRSVDKLRGLLEDGSADITAALVDDAFLQAHMLGVASIIANGAGEQDERLIERFAEQLRNTVPIARLL